MYNRGRYCILASISFLQIIIIVEYVEVEKCQYTVGNGGSLEMVPIT